MTTKKMVICPKCKAKIKFDPDKIASESVKFKCPGCATALSIRIPGPSQEGFTSAPAGRQDPEAETNTEHPEAKFLHLASKFGIDQDFAGDDQADDADEVVWVPESGAANEVNPLEMQRDKDASARKPETENAKVRDSRKSKRFTFKKKILVNNQIMVDVLNISRNGLFLHTGRSFEDGSLVEVGIPTLPGNFDLKVAARVKHNHRGIGMGLQFVDLDDKQRMQLDKLISELDTAAANDSEGRQKILLVGGSETARNINKSKLVLEGFYVMQATTPDEVFRILDNEKPDAMVMEWQETKFNCRGMLAKIKANPQYKTIIRVVLAVLTDSSVQREILDAGAHRCMAKMDTNPVKLAQVLRKLIEERGV